MLLKDKVCLITGAASLRSIGYATAELFAMHGARIAVVDITMDEAALAAVTGAIQKATGSTAAIHGARCDLCDADACDRVVKEVVDRFGTLDSIVNCAGVVQAQSMLSIAEPDYDRILDVNLKGTFNICRSALAVFKQKSAGSIINLGSVAAQRGGGLVGGAHYAASKGPS